MRLTATFAQLPESRTGFGGLAVMAATIKQPSANSAVASREYSGEFDFARPEPLAE